MRDGTKTRENLQKIALTLFVEQGVDKTTIRDIAQKAHIAEGAMYRHYESKDALAKDLYVTNSRAIKADFISIRSDSQDLEACLSSIVIYLCRLYDANPTLFRYIFLTPYSNTKMWYDPEADPVLALQSFLAEEFTRRSMNHRNATIFTSQILGTILQTVQFKVAGKLDQPLVHYSDELVYGVFKLLRD